MARPRRWWPRSPRVGAPALAQPPVENAQTLQKLVERFLLHLGDHQFDAVADDLMPAKH